MKPFYPLIFSFLFFLFGKNLFAQCTLTTTQSAPSCYDSITFSSVSSSERVAITGTVQNAAYRAYLTGSGCSGYSLSDSVLTGNGDTLFINILNGGTCSPCSVSVDLVVKNVSDSSQPATGITLSAFEICNGGSVTLTASGGFLGTGAVWHWYYDDCIAGTPVDTGVSITDLPTPSDIYSYFVRAEGVCNTTDCETADVEVYDPPTVSISGATGVCVGGSVVLTANLSGGIASSTNYTWQRNGGSGWATVASGPGTTYTTSTALSVGSYLYRVLAAQVPSGCTAQSSDVSANVSADPVAPGLSTSPASDSVCAGTSLTVFVSSGSGGLGSCSDEYRYSTDGGSSWTSWSSSVPTIVSAPQGVSIIESRRSCTGSGCLGTSSVSWVVNGNATGNAGADDTVCANYVVPPIYILNGSAANYSQVTWTSLSGLGTFSDQNDLNSDYSPDPIDMLLGFVKLELLIEPIAPCATSIRDTFQVNFVLEPEIFPGADTAFCRLDTILLLGAVATNSVNHTWSSSRGSTFLDPTDYDTEYYPSVAALSAGYDTLRLTVTPNAPCSGSYFAEKIISFSPDPVAVAFVDSCMTTNPSLKDYVRINTPVGTPPFSFAFSGGSPVSKFSGDEFSIYKMDMSGSSEVVTVTDALGCITRDTFGLRTSVPAQVSLSSSTGNKSCSCHIMAFNEWVTLLDENDDAVLSVLSDNTNLGKVSAQVYVESAEPSVSSSTAGSCNGATSLGMKRHYVIEADSVPQNPVTVRLYFTDDELSDLQTASLANGTSDCQLIDDVTSIADLYITKYSGPNTDNDYSNNQNTGIFRLFGDPGALYTPDGSLSKVSGGFDTEFGTSTGSHYVELSVTEFSEFWFHGTGIAKPLPVGMIMLEANVQDDRFIRLDWATASEINNSGFEVFRSTDGENYSMLGFVKGGLNTSSRQDYLFNDKEVSSGITYYYKLRQVDVDGKYSWTPAVSARLKTSANATVLIYPNPAKEQFSLISSGIVQDSELIITDLSGREFYRSSSLPAAGAAIQISSENWPSGTYFYKLSSEYGSNTGKFNILH